MRDIIALIAVSTVVIMIGIIFETPLVTIIGGLLFLATFVFVGIRDRIS